MRRIKLLLYMSNRLLKTYLVFLSSALGLAMPVLAQAGKHPSGPRVVSIEETSGSGMCIGYCIFELQITATTVRFRERAFRENRQSIPNRKVKAKITKEEWNRLLVTFDIGSFWSLPDRIGCPGCVDEITEAIEIKLSDGAKKSVFYNSGDAPAPILDLAAKIDALELAMREKIKRKYPNPVRLSNPD